MVISFSICFFSVPLLYFSEAIEFLHFLTNEVVTWQRLLCTISLKNTCIISTSLKSSYHRFYNLHLNIYISSARVQVIESTPTYFIAYTLSPISSFGNNLEPSVKHTIEACGKLIPSFANFSLSEIISFEK